MNFLKLDAEGGTFLFEQISFIELIQLNFRQSFYLSEARPGVLHFYFSNQISVFQSVSRQTSMPPNLEIL
jgi:hypothetical protein